jgi:SAM-dependent methyltransferase
MSEASLPKPKHLGRDYGDQFADPAVVAAYHHRPPYPAEVFGVLQNLVVGTPRAVLDLGCGTGDLARPLAAVVDAVDAVDSSAGMIERGRGLPGGDRPNLRWILGQAEDAPLPRLSYGLVTAGESLHWMDWYRLFPRLAGLLAPGAYLALVGRGELPTPWWDELLPIIQRYSTNRDYQPYDLIEELEKRELFEPCGVERTPAVPVRQSIESYIESTHSRNGLSRDRMTADSAAAFDREVEQLLVAHFPDRILKFDVVGGITWGNLERN